MMIKEDENGNEQQWRDFKCFTFMILIFSEVFHLWFLLRIKKSQSWNYSRKNNKKGNFKIFHSNTLSSNFNQTMCPLWNFHHMTHQGSWCLHLGQIINIFIFLSLPFWSMEHKSVREKGPLKKGREHFSLCYTRSKHSKFSVVYFSFCKNTFSCYSFPLL